jgi:hypothetical protein
MHQHTSVQIEYSIIPLGCNGTRFIPMHAGRPAVRPPAGFSAAGNSGINQGQHDRHEELAGAMGEKRIAVWLRIKQRI